MRPSRILGTIALASLMAFVVSACQKSAQTDMSSTGDTTQVSQGTALDQTSPQAQPGAQGATLPDNHGKGAMKGTKSAHTSKGSGSSKESGSQATYAEHHTVEIPAGTNFDVEMVTPVDTRTSNVGDKVEAKLAAPLVVGDKVVAEAGSRVTGSIADLKRASRGKGQEDRASIALDFNSLETVDGPKTLHATINNAEGKMVAKGTGTRDKLLIGGGAVVGGVIGKVAGGSTKSTIIGAVAGTAAGTGAVLMAKGHELEIPEGAKVSLRVDRPIMVVER